MKYWRGFLIAGLISAFGWGLVEFAKSHITLMDMVYPYMSRMIMTSMAEWSSQVDFCIWQVLLVCLVVLVLASAVLMIVLKWNVIQWAGWVAASACLISFVNLGVYGLNSYSGNLKDDIRLEVSEYSISQLEEATRYYRDQANTLAGKVSRDADGNVQYAEFEDLAQQAADGFESLVYDEGMSIFAGSLLPVKALGAQDIYGDVAGITVGITGESAVNTENPDLIQPFVMCREMARRMTITSDRDSAYASVLACSANSSREFQYSGYFMAYRMCYEALAANPATAAKSAAQRVSQGENVDLARDMQWYTEQYGVTDSNTYLENEKVTEDTVYDMLVNKYIQEEVLPNQVEPESKFDPLDETQVDLSTTINDITETEEATEGGE